MPNCKIWAYIHLNSYYIDVIKVSHSKCGVETVYWLTSTKGWDQSWNLFIWPSCGEKFNENFFVTGLSDEDGALLFPSCANFSRSFQKLKLIDC